MNFILIPGAWMGPWIWERVAGGLRDLGHQVYPVALTGLETAYGDVSDVSLETHVNDVISVLQSRNLYDVILVGHTLTGAIAGIVADRIPERVAHTVYVEAFLPYDGKSILDAFPAALRADEERLIAGNHGTWPIPDASVVADGQDLTIEQAKWMVERFVAHPGRALTDHAVLKRPVSQQRTTYVVCRNEHFSESIAEDIEAMTAQPTWSFRTLDTGLWPMVSAPDTLVTALAEIAWEHG